MQDYQPLRGVDVILQYMHHHPDEFIPIIEFDGVRYPMDKYFIIGDHVVANVRGNRWQTLKEDEYFRVRMVDVTGSSHRINPLPEMITERKRREREEREEQEERLRREEALRRETLRREIQRLTDSFTGQLIREQRNTNLRDPFA